MNTLPPNAIASGVLRHRRFLPHAHEFEYPLSMVMADVTELAERFPDRGLRLVRFRAADYYRHKTDRSKPERQVDLRAMKGAAQPTSVQAYPALSLKTMILDKVSSELGRQCDGTVYLLTQLRQWGYCFNPVSFYFVWDRQGALDAIVAEITNTPWHERHQYVIDAQRCALAPGVYDISFDKHFHVSPFMPMDIVYRWRFAFRRDGMSVFMSLQRNQQRCFDAGLTLRYGRFGYRAMREQAWRQPLQCQRIAAAIYWQALRLWWKKTPFFPHPKHSDVTPS